MVNVTADFTQRIKSLIAYPVSGCISTYGTTVAKSSVQRDVLGKLKLGLYRIPLKWNAGTPISSAGGGPQDILGDDFITAIRSFGGEPMIVMGGTSDNNFTPADCANMVRHYGSKVRWYVIGNEPNNGGMTIETYCTLFNNCVDAMRAVDSGIHIAGPTWSYYDSGRMQTFVNSCGSRADIVDYHHYAMGSTNLADGDAMKATLDWGTEVAAIYKMLSTAGKVGKEVQVGEFNWSWRYQDGVSGGDNRFYKAIAAAWSASVVGRVLSAGGRAHQYSDQNGPLGLTIQPGNTNPDNRPGNTPMPIYHGMGMWTGESLFPGVPNSGAGMYGASSDNSLVEAYAVSPGNVVLVNKSPTTQTITLTIKGVTGSYDLWQTDPNKPYDAPVKKGSGDPSNLVSVSLGGYGIATVVTSSVTITPTDPPVIPPTTTTTTGPTAADITSVKASIKTAQDALTAASKLLP